MIYALKIMALAALVLLQPQSPQKKQQQPSTKYSTYVEGIGYKGYAFCEEFDTEITVENQTGRFTPSTADIAECERLVRKKVAILNDEHESQENGLLCPLIDEHLDQYVRQYIGFIDEAGDRIMWVNFVWSDKYKKLLSYEIPNIEGGCSHFFRFKVNLDKRTAYGFEVNATGDAVYTKPVIKRKYRRVSRPKGR